MPLTDGFTSRSLALKGKGHIHSDKWHRCWTKVQAKGSDKSSAAAICTHSIGYGGSVNPEHRTPGRHASANPKRFKTKEGQRNARARERAARVKKAETYAEVLKWNPFHGLHGWFSSKEMAQAETEGSGSGGLTNKQQQARLRTIRDQQRKTRQLALALTLVKIKAQRQRRISALKVEGL